MIFQETLELCFFIPDNTVFYCVCVCVCVYIYIYIYRERERERPREREVPAFTICFHKFFAFIMASMHSTVSKCLQLTGVGKLSQTPEPIFNAQHLFGSTNL